jgi:hypothetical protein
MCLSLLCNASKIDHEFSLSGSVAKEKKKKEIGESNVSQQIETKEGEGKSEYHRIEKEMKEYLTLFKHAAIQRGGGVFVPITARGEGKWDSDVREGTTLRD